MGGSGPDHLDGRSRHSHKTSARGFDGYKVHIGIDPDAKVITGMTVTAGNVGDGSVAPPVRGGGWTVFFQRSAIRRV
jgi:hypothetical protein